MRLEKCYFCSSTCYPGHGSAFVRNDGKYFRFCRSKCVKNFKMKRNPRKVRWTKAFRKASGKEMTIDSTFEFEKRRNVPVRYDRDLMSKTLQAIKRIEEIRKKREKSFFVQRIEKGRTVERQELAKEVAKSAELLREPISSTQALKITEKRRTAAVGEKLRIKQKILASMARGAKMETD